MMISIVFIFVVCALSWILLKQEREMRLLAGEKRGIEIVSQLQQIDVLVEQHRGLAHRLLSGNTHVEKTLDALESQLDSAFEETLTRCQLPKMA